MNFATFWTAFGWFTLVWFATSGAFVIAMQFLLPRAWEQIRAQPPHGPAWAHTLWYQRNRVYAALMALSLVLATISVVLLLLGER